jgi:hypothetical protein
MLSVKIACATWIYKFQYAKKCKYNIISDLWNMFKRYPYKLRLLSLANITNIINQIKIIIK